MKRVDRTLLHGDCMDLMKDLPSKSIDMILADLPYGTTRNKWDSLLDLEKLWKAYERIIKDRGAIVLFSQQPFTSRLVASNPKMFRYEWIWVKSIATGFLNARRMPLKKHENILVFYKKLPTYNPQMTPGEPYYRPPASKESSSYGPIKDMVETVSETGDRFPVTVNYFGSERGLHPTQKPLDLCEYLIRTYTNEGDLVLDNVMGSGTTGLACKNLNRRFIGMELDQDYFEIAKERIESDN